LAANSVFMTIVQERPICVRTTVAEKELRLVQPGVAGRAVSVAFPNLKLPVKVETIAAVPTAEGNFDARLAVEPGGDAQSLLPGMTCNLTLLAYSKPDAVTVPPAAVFSDEVDDAKQFVYRVGADGSHQRTSVTVGQRTDTKVEILEGLLEGDKVLLENPEAK
jgi:multidrug efflux pump subunit AcrA (membrane-fusion protein)